MEESKKREVAKRGIFNEDGDIDLGKRKIIQGNTTNLNDFNNLKYTSQQTRLIFAYQFKPTKNQSILNLIPIS